eukprot:10765903-Alexandrium_andersonii.AAC.1
MSGKTEAGGAHGSGGWAEKRRGHGQAAGKDKRAPVSKAVLRQTQPLQRACHQNRCERSRQPLNSL